MQGIYVHIPFCRQACRYCDFYFTVSLKYMDPFVDALVEEIRQKSEITSDRSPSTLYLGGGTPSILSASHLDRILNALHRYYTFQKEYEWTIECNPDDLTETKLRNLQELGFNRLSVGVQSFHDEDLTIMRRSHDAHQAETSIRLAAAIGFKRITMDLIYGIPGLSEAGWEENIHKALSLPVSHLSAYHLTFEPGTVFDHWRKKGRLFPVPEEVSVNQYRMLRETLRSAGFEHYELSNFGRGSIVSKHNMIYWTGQPYLGLGPSAHTYDGERRSWNIASLKLYMERISSGKSVTETETLSRKDTYHDYLITSLRTRWGADAAQMERAFGKLYLRHFEKQARPFLENGSMKIMNGKYTIDPSEWLITDHILRALFRD